MKKIKLYNRDNFDVYFVETFDFINSIFEGYLEGNFISVGIDYNEDGTEILALDPNGGPQIIVKRFVYIYTDSDNISTQFELIKIEFDEDLNRYKLIFDYVSGEPEVTAEYLVIENDEQDDRFISGENEDMIIT